MSAIGASTYPLHDTAIASFTTCFGTVILHIAKLFTTRKGHDMFQLQERIMAESLPSGEAACPSAADLRGLAAFEASEGSAIRRAEGGCA